jgi:hypothetical protein
MPRIPTGGKPVTTADIIKIVGIAAAIVGPPAFIWLGVLIERRKGRGRR